MEEEIGKILELDKVIQQAARHRKQVMKYVISLAHCTVDLEKDFDEIVHKAREDKIRMEIEETQARNRIWHNYMKLQEEAFDKAFEQNRLKPIPQPMSTRSNFIPKLAEDWTHAVPIRFRRVPKVSTSCKSQKLPRPVWNIICEMLDPLARCKFERVCRLFYHIANPACQCTCSSRHSECKSMWYSYGAKLAVRPVHDQANCILVKNKILQYYGRIEFLNKLNLIREIGCGANMHAWETNPTNESYVRCAFCRTGLSKDKICGVICINHKLFCNEKKSKFFTCSSHRCSECTGPYLLKKAYSMMRKLSSECKEISINIGGKRNSHKISYKIEL
jgi:hypothetical protein